jgi:RNA polymerase sigma-70 factor (ECF subfamily)
MFKIVRNLALDHVKRAEHRLSVPWDEDPEAGYTGANIESDDVFQQSAAREEFVLFCEAVRKLPAQCRRVFVLKKVYGYSQLEIAEELGLSESTVEKHVALGVRRCHKFMNDRASSSSGSINPLGANRG